MCTLSFVILRNARKKPDIASLLQQFCSSVGCGVNFDSTGALQELPFLVIQQEDLSFEIYDRHSLINSGIFMSLDMPLRTNTPPRIPLETCFSIVQQVFTLCLPWAESAEFYLTNSHASEEDFTELAVPVNTLASFLKAQYAQVPDWCFFVPDLHLFVT